MNKFFGWVFMIVGLLIATPSGLCTALATVMVKPLLSDFGTIFVIGILPCLAGVGLFLLGYKMIQETPPKADDTHEQST